MESKFGDEFFGELTITHANILNNLTWGDISPNNYFVRFDDFNLFAGFPLPLFKYNKLKQCFENIKKRNGGGDSEPIPIETFFRKLKKGSRHFRKIFCHFPLKDNYYQSIPQIKRFLEITDSAFSDSRFWAMSLNRWNTYCFPNRLRSFLYKYYGNILGTGNRVAHFNRDINPACTFCTKARIFPAPLESFSHVFLDCTLIGNIVDAFCVKYFNFEITRQVFFAGNTENVVNMPNEVYLILDILRYTIWQIKLQKQRPSFSSIEFETLRTLDIICGISNKLKQQIIHSQFINVDGVREPAVRQRP